MTGKVWLLDEFPVDSVVQSKWGDVFWEFQVIDTEKLRELIRDKVVMNAIRHEGTWRALLPILGEASKIKFVDSVDFNEVDQKDIIIIVVPKEKESEVKLENLLIIRVTAIGVDLHSAYYVTYF